jgi:phage repressor protein C with HTH and peptisase S24 domain
MSPTYAYKIAPILDCSIENLMDGNFEVDKNNKSSDTITIDIISATPCCGNGNDCTEETIGKWVMPIQDFKRLTQTSPERVKQMQVSGDSMQPTINDGDFILADTSHNVFDVDGIYLIRMISGLAVKRLQAGLNTISIISDNPNYKPIEASIGEVKIIGKVIKILNVRSV